MNMRESKSERERERETKWERGSERECGEKRFIFPSKLFIKLIFFEHIPETSMLGISAPKIPQFNCYQMRMHCTFRLCWFGFRFHFSQCFPFSVAISISFRACLQPYQRLGQHLIPQHTIDNNCELCARSLLSFAVWLINVGPSVWIS